MQCNGMRNETDSCGAFVGIVTTNDALLTGAPVETAPLLDDTHRLKVAQYRNRCNWTGLPDPDSHRFDTGLPRAETRRERDSNDAFCRTGAPVAAVRHPFSVGNPGAASHLAETAK
jgi:hypothetical protein